MTSNAGSDRRDGSVGFGRTVSEQTKEKACRRTHGTQESMQAR